ncbi:UDP-glycosyltransferase 87A1 [Ziziphus jujuba]|uniref:UDP-glycosyltransferase 87A1 n=1 Tax=Ziziphus jujuba TaxID=326968 RepID=A0ABM3I9R5_ZIZJJ|nr:UDP-glycosyltransferase 87A1 [Ziziphus jujuba]
MDGSASSICHVVAMPYPGRGHVNPMMNLCKQLVSRSHRILVTFVVTEEWSGFIDSEPRPHNIRLGTLPNVIPSEHDRANDFPGFVEAVATKLEAPFERLLDRLEPPVSAIIADNYVVWAGGVGNRRNIPVALLWTMSASVFSVLHHFELLVQNGHFPLELSERGQEVIEYIPGISRTRIVDLPTMFHGNGRKTLGRALEAANGVSKAKYLLFTSACELESQVIDALKAKISTPVYPVGPSIPYFLLENENTSLGGHDRPKPKYLQWLDSQPERSVLYISMGSFLSVSNAQLDEIVCGVQNSGVRYLWVVREDTSVFKDGFGGDIGLVVPWCDQLRVLCHPSIGGFWTHCGWNSTLEAVFAGVPMLTCPIFYDQIPNRKRIVEDWKIGYDVKKENEGLVTRDEISELVQRVMDPECKEGKEMRKRAKELQEACHGAIAKGGSSDENLDAFIRDILQGNCR